MMNNEETRKYLDHKLSESDDKQEREAIARACFALEIVTDDAVDIIMDSYMNWSIMVNLGMLTNDMEEGE